MIELALFEPEIPQNTGTLLRLSACFGMKLHIIEPCGFIFSNRRLKRSGMDYIDHADFMLHDSWDAFQQSSHRQGKRLVLLTPHSKTVYTDFHFEPNDILMVGRESTGVPEDVMQAADATVLIPMKPETRSLNVAISASIVSGEALRQTKQLPV